MVAYLDLLKCFRSPSLRWNDAETLYTHLIPFLANDILRSSVMAGLALTIGSKNQRTVSKTALLRPALNTAPLAKASNIGTVV